MGRSRRIRARRQRRARRRRVLLTVVRVAIEQIIVLRMPGTSPSLNVGDRMPPEVVAAIEDDRGPDILDRSVRDLSHLIDPMGY